ncbi:MAG: hypothetical protein M1823_005476 [Watsoniomyces obsoletus]|nr:MAG: hypothetical protein M1823_005476 [Watsoniomyces obsoletus]
MSNGKSTPQPSEGATSSLVPGTAAAAMMDPTQLEFCRVLYDFSPELLGVGGGGSNNGGGTRTNNTELNVKKGDLVAVLSKLDPTTGLPSEWWRCRTRDGRPPALTTTATTRGEVVKAITGPSGNSNSGGGGQTSGATTTTVMNGTTTATSSNSSIPKELNAQRRQDGNTSSHEPGTMNNKDKDKEKDMMMRILENKEPGYTFTGGGLWNTGTSTGAANGIVDTNSSTITNGSGSGSGNADGNKGEKEKEGMVSVDGFRKSSFYNK